MKLLISTLLHKATYSDNKFTLSSNGTVVADEIVDGVVLTVEEFKKLLSREADLDVGGRITEALPEWSEVETNIVDVENRKPKKKRKYNE